MNARLALLAIAALFLVGCPSTPESPFMEGPPPTAAADEGSTLRFPTTYAVEKGDTLYGIAKKFYGQGRYYKLILAANPGLDPTRMRVGRSITLPMIEE